MPPQPKKRPPLEEIAKRFHLPLMKAAEDLGICQTLLKKFCRQYGISRWPYRKMKSLYMNGSPSNLEAIEAYINSNSTTSPHNNLGGFDSGSTGGEGGGGDSANSNQMDDYGQRHFHFDLNMQQDLILPNKHPIQQHHQNHFHHSHPPPPQQHSPHNHPQQQQHQPPFQQHHHHHHHPPQHAFSNSQQSPNSPANNNVGHNSNNNGSSIYQQHQQPQPQQQQQQARHLVNPVPLFRSNSSPSYLTFGENFKMAKQQNGLNNNNNSINNSNNNKQSRTLSFSIPNNNSNSSNSSNNSPQDNFHHTISRNNSSGISNSGFAKTKSPDQQMYGSVAVTAVTSPSSSPNGSPVTSPISSPVLSFEHFSLSSPNSPSPHHTPSNNVGSPFSSARPPPNLMRSRSLSTISHQHQLHHNNNNNGSFGSSPSIGHSNSFSFNSSSGNSSSSSGGIGGNNNNNNTNDVNNSSNSGTSGSNSLSNHSPLRRATSSGLPSAAVHKPYPPPLKAIGRARSSGALLNGSVTHLQRSPNSSSPSPQPHPHPNKLQKLPSLSQLFGDGFVVQTKPGDTTPNIEISNSASVPQQQQQPPISQQQQQFKSGGGNSNTGFVPISNERHMHSPMMMDSPSFDHGWSNQQPPQSNQNQQFSHHHHHMGHQQSNNPQSGMNYKHQGLSHNPFSGNNSFATGNNSSSNNNNGFNNNNNNNNSNHIHHHQQQQQQLPLQSYQHSNKNNNHTGMF